LAETEEASVAFGALVSGVDEGGAGRLTPLEMPINCDLGLKFQDDKKFDDKQVGLVSRKLAANITAAHALSTSMGLIT